MIPTYTKLDRRVQYNTNNNITNKPTNRTLLIIFFASFNSYWIYTTIGHNLD